MSPLKDASLGSKLLETAMKPHQDALNDMAGLKTDQIRLVHDVEEQFWEDGDSHCSVDNEDEGVLCDDQSVPMVVVKNT